MGKELESEVEDDKKALIEPEVLGSYVQSCDTIAAHGLFHFIGFAGSGWEGRGDRHWGKEAHQLHSRCQHELHQLYHWLRNHRYCSLSGVFVAFVQV